MFLLFSGFEFYQATSCCYCLARMAGRDAREKDFSFWYCRNIAKILKSGDQIAAVHHEMTSIVRISGSVFRLQRFCLGWQNIGAKSITLHNIVVSNSFPQLCKYSLHHRLGFESFPRLCNSLRCCKSYHVDIGLHYILVIEFIDRLCNLFFFTELVSN